MRSGNRVVSGATKGAGWPVVARTRTAAAVGSAWLSAIEPALLTA
jgi:hypothetical protein